MSKKYDAAAGPDAAIGTDYESFRQGSRILYDTMDAETDPFQRVVMERITRPESRFDAGSELYGRFVDLLYNQDRQHEDFFELGLDIGADIVDNTKSDRDKVLGLINAYASMNFIISAFAVHGDVPDQTSHHRVSSFVTATILDTMPDYEKNKRLFTHIHTVLDELEERLLNPELARLFQIYSNALVLAETYDTSRKIAAGEGRQRLLSSYDNETPIDDDTEKLSTLLTREAMAHRKYGTKPAYIEASAGGAWVFYDGEYYKEKIGMPYDVGSNIAAVVFHVDDPKPKDLRLFAEDMNPDLGGVNHGVVRVGGAVKKTNMALYIMHDGNITTDYFGLDRIEATHSDQPLAAQRMKAEVVSNFYDLSMPLYRPAPEPKNYATMSGKEKKQFDPIEQLLIPRIRYLDQKPRETSDVTRIVREHDVSWFVRLLPAGFHASAEAIASAKRHGIELETNETFVKEHKRGSRDKSVYGYHAVKRTVN
jgi:hypothetical protein